MEGKSAALIHYDWWIWKCARKNGLKNEHGADFSIYFLFISNVLVDLDTSWLLIEKLLLYVVDWIFVVGLEAEIHCSYCFFVYIQITINKEHVKTKWLWKTGVLFWHWNERRKFPINAYMSVVNVSYISIKPAKNQRQHPAQKAMEQMSQYSQVNVFQKHPAKVYATLNSIFNISQTAATQAFGREYWLYFDCKWDC